MANIKSRFAKTMAVFLAAAVASAATLASVPLAARADTPSLTIVETSGSGGFAQDSSGNFTISKDGNYTITGNGVTTSTVSVDGCKANITLDNVDIKPSSGCAFEIYNNATANLTLVGANTLNTSDSTSQRAGLSVSVGNTVNISGTGSLTAIAGECSAGIGGNNEVDIGTVNISGGTVNAQGNCNGIGCGHNCDKNGGIVNISGGNVTATSNTNGAGIASNLTTISGGIVSAIGTDSGAGINSGVNISGGTVSAKGGDYGAGIGGESSGSVSDITISGGTVTAIGGYLSAGIGGGGGHDNNSGGSGGQVKISGAGTVVSATGNGGAKDIGAGYGNSDDGSLTVGTADVTASLPTVILESAGTNATTTLVNCFVVGSGAGTLGGVYGATNRIAPLLDASKENIAIGNNTVTAEDSSGNAVSPNSSNTYVISGTAAHTVTVSDCTANIMLYNANITPSSGCAFELDNGATVNLTLLGQNTLDTSGSSSNCAGLSVNAGNTVNISGTGSLTAKGGSGGAGIGGNSGGSCGTVSISGGNVTANGGAGGSGIGGGDSTGDGNGTGSGGSTGGNGGIVSISGADTVVLAAGSGGGQDVGSGSNGTGGGSLTVGTSSDCPSLLPTLKLETSMTNAATAFVNCIVGDENSQNTYYAINYVDGGINRQAPISYVQGTKTTIARPTKTGYTFGGWYSDAQFTNPVPAIGPGQTGIVTLYAKWLSNDNSLSALSLSSGTLSPSFSPATSGYTASVGSDVSSVTVTASVNEANASIKVNGTSVASGAVSGNIQLDVGSNTITIQVAAQSGATNTYTVIVTRAASESSLSALSLSSGTLSPSFSPAKTGYTASVGNSISNVTVTASASYPNATFKVNDKAVASDGASGSIPLNVGDNTITVEVTAQSGATCTYTVIVTRAAASSGGSGTIVIPLPVTVTGAAGTNADGTATTAASIPLGDLGSGTSTVTTTLGTVSVTAPAGVLNAALGGGASLTLSQNPSPAATQNALFNLAAANGDVPIAALDLNSNAVSWNGTSTAVHALSDNVTVNVTLTKAQIALLDGATPDICYYDTNISPASLVDMHATFNASTGVLTFTTNHFSTWLIEMAGTAPAAYTPGVSYSAHVQHIGWQGNVLDSALCGTTDRALRMEALHINLTGSVPAGASIIYQAHVQHIGWQEASSDGTLAGTTGKSLRMEALRITLNGLSGYAVRYRAYVQHFGWLDWQQTANGSDISKAAVAGTTGKCLRMEALQIEIVKVS